MPQLKKILRTVIPWGVTLVIFYYLFQKYPLETVLQSIHYVNLPWFLLYVIGYFLLVWLVDCWVLSWLFTRFGFPTKIREVSPVRLASYLIAVVNYGAAQGMMAYFFKKAKGVPFFKTSGLVLFLMIIDLYWVIFLAFVGSFFTDLVLGGVNLSRAIQTLWGGATVGMIALIVFWRLPLNWRAIRWVRSRDLFHTFHQARVGDYLIAMVMRLPMLLAINTSFYFIALTFNVHIPFFKVLAYLPVVLLVGTIPLTPGGLGAVQLATVEFFKNAVTGPVLTQGLIGPQELLLAMSLYGMFANYLLKALTGAFFFRKALNASPSK